MCYIRIVLFFSHCMILIDEYMNEMNSSCCSLCSHHILAPFSHCILNVKCLFSLPGEKVTECITGIPKFM